MAAALASRSMNENPAIAAERLAATVLGDAERVGEILAADPEWVARPDGERGWTPLFYACYSLWHRAGPSRADASVATVRLLLGAGAGPQDAWVAGKPPSDEVADVLSAHGVASSPPNPEAEDVVVPATPAPDDERDLLEEVGEQLRAAYEEGDIELFGSLLHPEVRFGGGSLACNGRDEIVARYSTMLRLGVRGEVIHLETAPGALIVAARFAGRAEGVCDPQPDVAYQRFTVADGLITAINGHANLASARQAANP